LELLLLIIVPKAIPFLIIALVARVIPVVIAVVVVVVVLVGGVELLPLATVGDEVGGVATLEAVPR
jgi:hypothetical protein